MNESGRRVGRLIAWLFADWLVLLGVGFVLTKAVHGSSGEDGVNRYFAEHRTGTWNTITHYVTLTAETITVVVTVAVVASLLLWRLRRWRPSLFLVAAVAGQALVFFCVQLLISRNRPDVIKLDASPPTSSFPSGHTGAGTAMWASFFVLAAVLSLPPAWRKVLMTLAVVMPVAVALSRLYRGMHHPTDVLFGMLNGIATTVIAYFCVLKEKSRVLA